ncbi:MAG: PTS sugar transporter subunit IIA [Eubacterium sp.]|nr:PTS sugar transporter subunit IIA [Eubacterium sp.]
MSLHIDYIQTGIAAADRGEAIAAAAAPLLKNRSIDQTYLKAVLEREAAFPTGLPTAVGVAIPHAAPEGVFSEAVSMVTLKAPVSFQAMGAPEEQVPVSIVFLLAIKDGEAQLETLQQLVAIIQDEMVLHKIMHAKTPEKVYNLFKEFTHERKCNQ